jgi:hypothetical protein
MLGENVKLGVHIAAQQMRLVDDENALLAVC